MYDAPAVPGDVHRSTRNHDLRVPVIPQLSRGNDHAYTWFLDFGTVYGLDLVTPAFVREAFDAAWRLVDQVRVAVGDIIRLTTIYPGGKGPWNPVYGLRPGEYCSIRIAPLDWRPGSGGTTTQKCDRNPSLYLPNESYVILTDPEYTAVSCVHELGHACLQSWPPGEDQSGHDANPGNVMYAGELSRKCRWNPAQTRSLAHNLYRVRALGVRLGGPVQDGGRPAWPIPSPDVVRSVPATGEKAWVPPVVTPGWMGPGNPQPTSHP